MSRIQADIENLRSNIKEWEELITFEEAIRRLTDNPDFKKVIRQDYFVDETARLAMLAGDPNMNAAQKEDALAMALASGHLKRYLSAKLNMAANARSSIVEANNLISELQNMSEEQAASYERHEFNL